jgi:hypothetical protein
MHTRPLTSTTTRSSSLVSLALGCFVACSSPRTDAPGDTGSGGTGAGGNTSASGGASGSGGTAGSGGSGVGGAGGIDASVPDAGDGTVSAAAYLDECFAGLRSLGPRAQIATKRSANGGIHVRLALEVPPGGFGTSGTLPWAAVRLAIVTPQKRLCIKEEAVLKTAYKGSLHNCMDSLSVTSDGLVFLLKAPDTDPMRDATTFGITGDAAIPTTPVPTVSCTTTSGAVCKSGGPC